MSSKPFPLWDITHAHNELLDAHHDYRDGGEGLVSLSCHEEAPCQLEERIKNEDTHALDEGIRSRRQCRHLAKHLAKMDLSGQMRYDELEA